MVGGCFCSHVLHGDVLEDLAVVDVPDRLVVPHLGGQKDGSEHDALPVGRANVDLGVARLPPVDRSQSTPSRRAGTCSPKLESSMTFAVVPPCPVFSNLGETKAPNFLRFRKRRGNQAGGRDIPDSKDLVRRYNKVRPLLLFVKSATLKHPINTKVQQSITGTCHGDFPWQRTWLWSTAVDYSYMRQMAVIR
ncbi:hypothetical protein EYF80_014596 [Liparis tanakae]|uniref:Uncharacterized protein n=1 Tax=Liparis tanakae TaxID=230148 RepID=A0A4Z2IAX2_9TELE|nr:hypothetical protein EYF80_014596 [Liparis tanakae]